MFTTQAIKEFFQKKNIEGNEAPEPKKGWASISKNEKSMFGLVAILVIAKFIFPAGVKHQNYLSFQVGDQVVYLEHFTSKKQFTQGLKGRPGLPTNSGAFFDLEKPKMVSITMDQVAFPIKVATLSPGLEVIEITTLEPGQEDFSFEKPCASFIEVHPGLDLRPGQLLTEGPGHPHLKINSSWWQQ